MHARDKRIVVGVDGSEDAARALRWAGSLAKDLDAEVVAVYALTPFGEFTLSLPPFPPRNLRREAHSQLEHDWCAPLRELGVCYRSVVVESGPVPALLRVSEREHAELIVVGGHRHGTLTDHIVGTVAARLVHRGTVPVVVVPVRTTTDPEQRTRGRCRLNGNSGTSELEQIVARRSCYAFHSMALHFGSDPCKWSWRGVG